MKDKNTPKPLNESELIDQYIKGLDKKEKQTRTKKYRPRYKRRPRFLMPFFIILLGILVVFSGLVFTKVINIPDNLIKNTIAVFNDKNKDEPSSNINLPNNEESEQEDAEIIEPIRPSKLFGIKLSPNTEYSLTDLSQNSSIINELEEGGFTTIFLQLNAENTLVTDNDNTLTIIKQTAELAHQKSMSIFGVVDINKLSDLSITKNKEEILQKLVSVAKINELDGIMLDGVSYSPSKDDFKEFISLGVETEYKTYSVDLLTSFVRDINKRIKSVNPTLFLGLMCDSIYATETYKAGGISVEAEHQMLKDDNADILKWMKNKFFDIVFVNANTSTESKTLPFNTLIKWWSENTPSECDIGFVLSSESASKGEDGFKNPDQPTRQLMALNEINRMVFCFDSYTAFKEDKTGGAALVYKYLNGEVEEDPVLRELSFTSPTKTTYTTFEKSAAIIGASDPNFELLLNGEPVKRTEYGYFSLQLDLKVGKNKFTFTHKGTTKTFNITYKYTVLTDYSPTKNLTLMGGDSLIVRATARIGSKVTATLNKSTVNLKQAEKEENTDFATFSGVIKLPKGSTKDINLGKIKFTATHSGVTESFYGGAVTLEKTEEIPSVIIPPSSSIIPSSSLIPSVSDAASYIESENSSDQSSQNQTGESGNSSINSSGTSSKTPTSSTVSYSVSALTNPISVGNKLIAEVSKYQIETFNGGSTVDDLSLATNSYLPKGTLDYASENTDYDPSSGNRYRLLRYGKRVYTTSKGEANIKTMRGTLPSSNQLEVRTITTGGSHTVLTLNTAWKAPFTVQILPQKYQGGDGKYRTTISSRTFTYLDITFAYANKFLGNYKKLEESKIFKKVELIKNTSGYTLRLHLEKKGEFYGWTADYDSNGRLVFRFTNPKKATKSSNKYGGRLDGIKIVVDAGHGGSDGGASGSNPKYDEAALNLTLAKLLESKLESIGATVVMTRTTDASMTSDERILKVRNARANLAVSVHRDAATNTTAHGFGAYYFNPYTHQAAQKIDKRVEESKAYRRNLDLRGHVFYLSRISTCPVVLTENGFVSNSTDYNNMMKKAWNDKCADAIVKGIVDYFLEIG